MSHTREGTRSRGDAASSPRVRALRVSACLTLLAAVLVAPLCARAGSAGLTPDDMRCKAAVHDWSLSLASNHARVMAAAPDPVAGDVAAELEPGLRADLAREAPELAGLAEGFLRYDSKARGRTLIVAIGAGCAIAHRGYEPAELDALTGDD